MTRPKTQPRLKGVASRRLSKISHPCACACQCGATKGYVTAVEGGVCAQCSRACSPSRESEPEAGTDLLPAEGSTGPGADPPSPPGRSFECFGCESAARDVFYIGGAFWHRECHARADFTLRNLAAKEHLRKIISD